MSEKRFVQCEIEYGFANTINIKKIDGIYDMQEEKTYRIEQIVGMLNEQQDTISQLQNLCGQSDGENAKLRIENKRLQEENEQLKKQLELRTESDKYHQRMLMKWLCKDDGDGV